MFASGLIRSSSLRTPCHSSSKGRFKASARTSELGEKGRLDDGALDARREETRGARCAARLCETLCPPWKHLVVMREDKREKCVKKRKYDEIHLDPSSGILSESRRCRRYGDQRRGWLTAKNRTLELDSPPETSILAATWVQERLV